MGMLLHVSEHWFWDKPIKKELICLALNAGFNAIRDASEYLKPKDVH